MEGKFHKEMKKNKFSVKIISRSVNDLKSQKRLCDRKKNNERAHK